MASLRKYGGPEGPSISAYASGPQSGREFVRLQRKKARREGNTRLCLFRTNDWEAGDEDYRMEGSREELYAE